MTKKKPRTKEVETHIPNTDIWKVMVLDENDCQIDGRYEFRNPRKFNSWNDALDSAFEQCATAQIRHIRVYGDLYVLMFGQWISFPG